MTELTAESYIDRIPSNWWSVPPRKKKKMVLVSLTDPATLEIVGEDALNFFRRHREGETQRYYWIFKEFDGLGQKRGNY